MTRTLVAIAALFVVSTSGCSDDVDSGVGPECADCSEPAPVDAPEGAEPLLSSLTRETPVVSTENQESLVRSLTGFSLDLYRSVRREEEGNLLFSPQSIATAFTMVYAGAEGETERQIAEALRFALPEEELLPAFNVLDAAFASHAQAGVELKLINAGWVQTGYPFLPSYLDNLAVNFGAGLFGVDFTGDREAVRQEINGWVAEQTASRIDDLLPADVLLPTTKLVLTNAVYFNASWQREFDPEDTEDAEFQRADGTAVTVPMMQSRHISPSVQTDQYKAVELPYSGDGLAMVAILPSEGQNDWDSQWTEADLERLIDGLAETELTVRLPRFSFSFPLDLPVHLQNLGMVDAFDENAADLSGMDGTNELFVSDALHQAFIEVTEAGTEAAAATAVVITSRSGVPVVQFDRPFLFLIRDRLSGAILFLGRVADPSL